MRILFATFLLSVAAQVSGQQIASTVSSIRVTGDATVITKPQRAIINLGVLTQERQSKAAVTQNSRAMDGVMAALHRVLGADVDVPTVTYSLSPDFQYRSGGSKPAVSGYTLLNIVRVTLDDIDKVGAVIDAATQAGANHVESVQYTVRDPQAQRTDALRQAAARARADADTLAGALNLRIVRILAAEQSRDSFLPPPDLLDPEGRLSPGGDPGPEQPPNFVYSANVTLTVEVSPR